MRGLLCLLLLCGANGVDLWREWFEKMDSESMSQIVEQGHLCGGGCLDGDVELFTELVEIYQADKDLRTSEDRTMNIQRLMEADITDVQERPWLATKNRLLHVQGISDLNYFEHDKLSDKLARRGAYGLKMWGSHQQCLDCYNEELLVNATGGGATPFPQRGLWPSVDYLSDLLEENWEVRFVLLQCGLWKKKPQYLVCQALLAELYAVTKNDLIGASILTEHEDGIQTGIPMKDKVKVDAKLPNGRWFHVKVW
jgi:hypothetical protein